MEKERKSKIAERFTTFIFYISVLFFFIGFNFQDSRTGGWIQQFLPSLPGNPPINDITFTDSLTGYATTYGPGGNDTDYVIKTTNGGNNWLIIRTEPGPYNGFDKLFFLNKDTGYIASYVGISTNISNLQKTTNGGLNWISLYWPTSGEPSDLFVLNTDTIWMCSPSNFGGGLYRTINGGLSWQLQYNVISGNPNKIYMYNARIGFISAGGYIYKTTNSGTNWTGLTGQEDFSNMFFVDSLKGFYTNYTSSGKFYKTTNGGNNWIHLPLPIVPGYIYTSNGIERFSYINDTIYGVRCYLQISLYTTRAIIYKSTNGGLNWGYQLPDTNWGFPTFLFTKFVNSKKGWCYLQNGIYTTTGGDTTIILSVHQISNEVPKEYKLYQNYPNPFNPVSNIKYQILKNADVKLIVFDISGKEIKTLVNNKQSSGTYEIKFDARLGGSSSLSSGIYFYSLFADGVRIDTKKMALIK
jgi:photosystem II stability/assembly factor-like uncharacterized protein